MKTLAWIIAVSLLAIFSALYFTPHAYAEKSKTTLSQNEIDKTIREANSGNPKAQFNLGIMYLDGIGVTQSYSEAAKWFEKAAAKGDMQSIYNLALMYSKGLGVQKNWQNAIKWFKRAALDGSIDAQFNLGIAYQTGTGVIKNEKEAYKWYEMAADLGDAEAQYKIGVMAAKGEGTPKNIIDAYAWLKVAIWQGTLPKELQENAILLKNQLQKGMTPKEYKDAEKIGNGYIELTKAVK